jgi:hypothetical protein
VNHPIVLLSNAFRKRIWKKGKYPLFDELYLVVTAAKLGIPDEALKRDPDFYDFAKVNAIHRYLLVFNHCLQINSDTYEISILYKGQYEKWKVEISFAIKLNENSRSNRAFRVSFLDQRRIPRK